MRSDVEAPFPRRQVTRRFKARQLSKSGCLQTPWRAWHRSLEEAARNLLTNHSISVVVASGNSKEDSCTIAPGERLVTSLYHGVHAMGDRYSVVSRGMHP